MVEVAVDCSDAEVSSVATLVTPVSLLAASRASALIWVSIFPVADFTRTADVAMESCSQMLFLFPLL